MVFILLFIFALIGVSVFLSDNEKIKNILLLFWGILLVCVATLRDGADHDYTSYVGYYNQVSTFGDYSVEPTFNLISKIVKILFFDVVVFLFFIYAALGVGLKIYAISKLTELKLLSLLSYFSFYFLMHDMTQMRAGVASALLLLCIQPLYERSYKKFLLITAIAVLFHYSALSIFLLIVLNPKRINKLLYGLLIPLGYCLCFLHLDITGILGLIPVAEVQNKVQAYLYLQDYSDNVELPNIFNVIFMLRCLVAMYLLFLADVINKYNKYVYILLKIYIWGLFSFLLFSNVAGFAFRISELYGIVEIILIPFICYTFVQRRFAYSFPMLVSTFLVLMELFYVKLFS